MKYYSEEEVRKLIDETNIHDGITGTSDDYLSEMKSIEIPDKHGRLGDFDALVDALRKQVMVEIPYRVKEVIEYQPTILEASK